MDSTTEIASSVDFTVRIAGEGGEGAISAGDLFAQAAARTANHVFTYITYPAEIKGGFAMNQVRVRDSSIYSMGSEVDYQIVFNQMAYDRTIRDIRHGGMLIYDPETVTINEAEMKEREVVLAPIYLNQIALEHIGIVLGKNVVALGALGHLFDIDKTVLEGLVADRYRLKGNGVIEKNIKALSAGYSSARDAGWPQKFHLVSAADKKEHYMFLSGNEAVALGAIAAGCRFVAGYPITPATPIFETLTKLMPMVGGKAIQLEDEIASISAIIGASFAGEKVITPTSGPGLQLMGEQLNLAAMLELPIVIVDVQRGGPSTGLPTKTEQSDLKFAIYGTAGESPRIILAPTSVEDCFYQTIRAFNLAERFQMPVIILSDQSIGYRKATVRIPNLENTRIIRQHNLSERIPIPDANLVTLVERIAPTAEELKDYKRFRITDDGISPITTPGFAGGQYLATGLEHTEEGKANYTPEVHVAMARKRFRKLDTVGKALDRNAPEFYGPEDAKIGIMGWGSTYGAIREARDMAEQNGILVKHLHPSVVSPLPEKQIRNFFSGLKQVIVVEENFTGQFAHFIKAKFGVKPIEFHKAEGVPFTPEEVLKGICKVAQIIDDYEITRKSEGCA